MTWVSTCRLAQRLRPHVRRRVVPPIRRLHVQFELPHNHLGSRLVVARHGLDETGWRYDGARGRKGAAPGGAGAVGAGADTHPGRQVRVVSKVCATHFGVAAVRHLRRHGLRRHPVERREIARLLCDIESADVVRSAKNATWSKAGRETTVIWLTPCRCSVSFLSSFASRCARRCKRKCSALKCPICAGGKTSVFAPT